ncbi:hypothetical protein V1514DRAFT_344023 [Lipomyces japonicus]|uniref:uncharacterized protein n=1 Tax=Lipomyces japonicus TaxID=56871 RepID=UPI0034CF6AF4
MNHHHDLGQFMTPPMAHNFIPAGSLADQVQSFQQQQQQHQHQQHFAHNNNAVVVPPSGLAPDVHHHHHHNLGRLSSYSRKRSAHDASCSSSSDDEFGSSFQAQSSRPHMATAFSVKRRADRPLDSHVQSSTLRKLFRGAHVRVETMPSDDLACEDCDNEIMLDEYLAEPDSYNCFNCCRTICWRCSLKAAETGNQLECLQCLSSRMGN